MSICLFVCLCDWLCAYIWLLGNDEICESLFVAVCADLYVCRYMFLSVSVAVIVNLSSCVFLGVCMALRF